MNSIAIIGSGFSGTMLTINLIKNYKSTKPLKISLIEREPDKLNLGVAYSTQEFEHLLNVRCGSMSMFFDEPHHLTDWLKSRGYTYNPDDFIPRKIYGEYLKYYFKKFTEGAPSHITVESILEEAVNIEKIDDHYKITLETRDITSNLVVLALGHISPAEISNLPKNPISRYFRTPWQDIYQKISKDDRVLLIGSGLTSNDVILSLRSKGHTGKISSISRSGNLPLLHEKLEAYPDFSEELVGKDINEIFSIVKKHLKMSPDIRPVIDSLRKSTQDIWKNLDEVSKSRFTRHLQSRWNVVRHRMPKESYDSLVQMIDSEILEYLSGRIIELSETDGKINLTWEDKFGNTKNLECDVVVNCIGPESNWKRINLSLIKNLNLQKAIKSDIFSIKTSNFKVISELEEDSKIWAIGPLLKGELYESTAVPEIRVQAKQLSRILISELEVIPTMN